jgi:hypothetical protein
MTPAMSKSRSRISGLTTRRIIAGAMAVGLATLGPVCRAEELPQFRKGVWEFNRTMAGPSGRTQTVATKKCTSPTDDMKKQNDMLAKAGCKFSAVTRSGSSYTFTSQCSVQGVSAQSKSVISVDSDAAYKVDVESQQGGEKIKEILVARRIGDC